jgi:hypothetical protein|tara:strand:- start:150 stop:491 length:342 start_codon:yes stop_codon:yes gene_type:complete
MHSINIKGQDVELVAPTSVADAYDCLTALGNNATRGMAAALGLCARGPHKPAARLKSHSQSDWLRFGGDVIDHYAKQGVALDEWLPQANEAVELVASVVSGTTHDEVTKAEGN